MFMLVNSTCAHQVRPPDAAGSIPSRLTTQLLLSIHTSDREIRRLQSVSNATGDARWFEQTNRVDDRGRAQVHIPLRRVDTRCHSTHKTERPRSLIQCRSTIVVDFKYDGAAECSIAVTRDRNRAVRCERWRFA
jgi:hypothetical protein